MSPSRNPIVNYLLKVVPKRLRWEFGALTKEAAYQRVLTGYSSEELFWASGKRDSETLSRYVDKNSAILDIGCGIGRVEKFLAPLCGTIQAIDISSRMLFYAKKEVPNPNVSFRRLDATKIAEVFLPNHFDLVFSLNTLQHMSKQATYQILKAIHTILKPEGTAYLHFLNFTHPHWFKKFIEQSTNDPAYLRFYTKSEVTTLLSNAGLQRIEIKHDKNGSEIYAICTKRTREPDSNISNLGK